MIASRLIALILLLLPWWEGGGTPFGIALIQSLVFLLALVLVFEVARGRRLEIRCGWEMIALTSFLVLSVLSAALAPYRFGAFLATWDRLVAALFVAAFLVYLPGRPGRGPVPPYWVAAVAVSGAAESLKVLIEPAPANLTASGSFANANHLGAWLNIVIFVSAGAIAGEGGFRAGAMRRGWRRLASISLAGVVLLGVAAILKTGSRAALGSLLAAAAIWAVRSAAGRPARARRWIWGGLALLAVAAAVAVAVRFQRVEDPYRYERTMIWRAGLQGMADHPLIGMGPGMFEPLGHRYNFPLDGEMFRYAKRASSAHSTPVQAGAETGVAGLLLAVSLIAWLAWRAIRQAGGGGQSAGSAMALLACLLHGLVDTPFAVPAVTLSLIAFSLPWLVPASLSDASLACARAWPAGRSAWAATAACALILLYLCAGGVLRPYAAHLQFERGARASRAGEPAAGLDEAIRLGPLNPLYVTTRAEYRQRPGRPLELRSFALADQDLVVARELNPADPATLVALGRLHARACFDLSAEAASAARAERYYREAIATGVRDPRPHAELASFLLTLGRASDAIPLLRAAIDLEPRFLRAHEMLTAALAEAGSLEETRTARAALGAAIEAVRGYVPKNAYEADLMKKEAAR